MELFTKTGKSGNILKSCPMLVFVVLCVCSVASKIIKEDSFLDAQFMLVGKDSLLIGHVLATYHVKGFHQCSITCISNPKCKAINYKYSHDNSSLQTCELTDATKSQTLPQFYISRTGFSYYEMVIDPEKVNYDPGCLNNITNYTKRKKSNCNCPGQHDGASCQIFYPKSCKDYQTNFGYHHDGEYYLYLNWPECENGAVIYCARMSSTTPLEYVTLPEGVEKNFAGSYNKNEGREEKTYFQKTNDCKRVKHLLLEPFDFVQNVPPTTERLCSNGFKTHHQKFVRDYNNNNGRQYKTYVQTIRLLLPENNVKTDDYTFVSRNYPGSFKPYATARDCMSNSCKVQYRKGRFNVDLTGTSFYLPQVIPYNFYSFPVCVRKVYAPSMSKDMLRWSGKCGGSCGSCWTKTLTLLLNGC